MKNIFIFVIAIFLVGCESDVISENNIEKTVVADANVVQIDELYSVYTTENNILKKYEPQNGIYNGVYLEEKNGEFIEQFEKVTKTNQSVYLTHMELGESFPLSWVLACYSNGKMPFITINTPTNIEQIFDRTLLKKMAEQFGELKIPMFVEVYPIMDNINDKENYIKFLQDASTYFKMFAPNVCFVWSLDYNMVYDAMEFYPGDSYVDWVGINIDENVDDDNRLNIMFKELDFVYNLFADKMPIFINVGISHFGDNSYTYNINDKINEIYRFFSYIPNKYPKIKMINYMNYDAFKGEYKNKQNYLVTEDKKLLKVYQEVLESDIYADNVVYSNNTKEIAENVKMSIVAHKIEGQFYVKNILYDDIKKTDLNKVIINGTTFYNLDEIINIKGKQKKIDHINKNIVLF